MIRRKQRAGRMLALGVLATLFAGNIRAVEAYSSFNDMVAAPAPSLPSVSALTTGPKIHWFSYYDVFEFDVSQRYLLGMEVDFEGRSPTPEDTVAVGMIDLEDGNKWILLGHTSAWCWQQGCRLQWRPGAAAEVLWNDREGEHYVCRVHDTATGTTRTLPHPVYHVSPDGQWALGLDFARVDTMRPGYGYEGVEDAHADAVAPAESGVYRMNLDTGAYQLLVSIADVAKLRFKGDEAPGKLYFNHIEWNPDGSRFLFFNRGQKVNTHVYTAAADGTELRFLAEDSSHYTWRDPDHVLIWTQNTYRLYKDDGSGESEVLWDAPNGHQTYLPGNQWILTDTYPLKDRLQHLYLYYVPTGAFVPLGRFESPPAYEGEWRCDTHPRLSRDGTKVVFDSPHGGNGRQLYLIDIAGIIKEAPKVKAAGPVIDTAFRERAVALDLKETERFVLCQSVTLPDWSAPEDTTAAEFTLGGQETPYDVWGKGCRNRYVCAYNLRIQQE